jgi:hypothetical protein
MVPLLHGQIRNARLIAMLKPNASFPNRIQLEELQLVELALGNAVAIEDNPRRLEMSRFVELNQQLANHRA